MLCSVAVSGAIWLTVSDTLRKRPDTERSGSTLTAFSLASWPGGSGIGGSPNCESCSGTSLLLDCFSLYLRVCACLYICGLGMCADSTFSHLPCLWPVGRGGLWERGTAGPALLLLSSALAASQMEAWLELAWKDRSCRRLSWDLVSDLKNAQLCRHLGCYVADCF